MNILRPGLAAIALLSGVQPAVAQNDFISRLHEQVLENIDVAGPGFALDSYGINRINAGETAHVTLDVPDETPVIVMGDCDADCTDLDLGVFSRDGTLLGEDRADDYIPIVRLDIKNEARVEIEIDLETCKAAFCYVAYSVFIGSSR